MFLFDNKGKDGEEVCQYSGEIFAREVFDEKENQGREEKKGG